MKTRIIIFGATSGIGLQTAIRLSRGSFEVHATGRDEKKIEQLKNQYPQIHFHVADSASESALESCLNEVGPVAHAVFALGGSKGARPFRQLDVADIEEGFQMKLFSQLRSLKAVLPHLASDGSLTFVSGVAAQMAAPGLTGPAAINGAIEAMIRPLAAELAPVRVNAVSPGVIETPWWNWLPVEQRKEVMDRYAKASFVGRVGSPDDIAHVIELLIKNTFCTGEIITCDGGLRLRLAS